MLSYILQQSSLPPMYLVLTWRKYC